MGGGRPPELFSSSAQAGKEETVEVAAESVEEHGEGVDDRGGAREEKGEWRSRLKREGRGRRVAESLFGAAAKRPREDSSGQPVRVGERGARGSLARKI